jgi:hypothetical protein
MFLLSADFSAGGIDKPATDVAQPHDVTADGSADRVAAPAQDVLDVPVALAAERDQVAGSLMAEARVGPVMHLEPQAAGRWLEAQAATAARRGDLGKPDRI